MNNVVLPSWTLILPESWDESKPDFKGEVLRERSPPRPSPLVFSVVFQDGGQDQRTSELSLKNACSAGVMLAPVYGGPLGYRLGGMWQR